MPRSNGIGKDIATGGNRIGKGFASQGDLVEKQETFSELAGGDPRGGGPGAQDNAD